MCSYPTVLISPQSPPFERALVRRRALLAFRTLATCNPDILRHVIDKMSIRLRDEDVAVVGAALSTCISLLEASQHHQVLVRLLMMQHLQSGLVAKDKLRPLLIKQLRAVWKHVDDLSKQWLLIRYIEVIRATGYASSLPLGFLANNASWAVYLGMRSESFWTLFIPVHTISHSLQVGTDITIALPVKAILT